MAETSADQDSFAYIPLSSFIIFLMMVILLTCASRRKKIDSLSQIEQSIKNDIKEDYAIMCFPCLKKKPDLADFEPVEDLSNQFEYIVEKYTIRKVPLLLANTVEDIIERREELEMAKTPQSQPQFEKDDLVNFQVSQEVYNIQRIAPCITVGSSVGCPGKKGLKERSKPSDILESMSPISRPTVSNNNYVVIPTKGSLRHKDIMMTKREITNQYLNNFSSVFVDNLKDQVPKDPEQFPSLSRPYTSAFKSFPIDERQMRKAGGGKKGRKGKNSKCYAYPVEQTDNRVTSMKEESFSDYDSTQDQTTAGDSESQEDDGMLDEDFTDKSLVLLKDSESGMVRTESLPNPFKTAIKSSSELNNASETDEKSSVTKDEWPINKNVTYEDIQALDVGYEFTSCEKLGVKPKMTRIAYPIEAEKFKENMKLAFGDSNKSGKRLFSSQEPPLPLKSHRTVVIKPPVESQSRTNQDVVPIPSRVCSSRSLVDEASLLEDEETPARLEDDRGGVDFDAKHCDESSTISINDASKTRIHNESELMEIGSGTDSVTEISKMYDLSMPVSHMRENASLEGAGTIEPGMGSPMPSKSRSFQSGSGPEVKGNDTNKNSDCQPQYVKLDEAETETTCSLYSHDSKTSSAMTTGVSSELEEGKRATLRWKIVIKHHRDEDPSKKNVNLSLRH